MTLVAISSLIRVKTQTQFVQGIATENLENQLSCQGDAISVGIGIGADTSNPDGKAKPVLQGIGYGKIDPVNKTSTTHAAITDQAGLSHINTENFKQVEVQNQLNEIITNDFDKGQALKELKAQTVITTEFGREIPKQIGDYAQTKELELLAQGNIEEAKKWAEGGIYRVALHTATAALATGTIEGVVSAGTTAYTIPKIDEYLKEQGFDETARHSALLALSAGIGATVGGDTASTVSNVGQVEWNYLTHAELSAWKSRLIECASNQQCIDNVNAEYNRANKTNFEHFENYCTINFDAQRCRSLIKRFQDGTQDTYNLKYLPDLYTDISKLGGVNASNTINTVKGNNAFFGYRVRDIGAANVNRYEGNQAQALIGEIANARDYGVGRVAGASSTASAQARDSSKNEKHGDGGRALSKAEKQISELQEQIKKATTKKERDRLQNKLNNIIRNAQKKKKGEEHSRGAKR